MSQSRLFINKKSGFTIMELLVVVAIVGILASVIGINAVESGRQSRDAKRQSDLRNLQSAVELYKNRYGEYPVDCSSNCGQYIVGLAPDFISVLPKEPGGGGYQYKTDGSQTVFKIGAIGSVESEEVDSTHEFASCDVDYCGADCPVADDDSYAVWGGFAPGDDVTEVRNNTKNLICNNTF